MEFAVVHCTCGGVVADGVKPRGLLRVICPDCKHRVWIQAGVVVRVDKRPKRLPRAA